MLYDGYTMLDIVGPFQVFTLLAEVQGIEAAEITQLVIEYDPHPPTDAGSPEKAPAAAVELVRSLLGGNL